VPHALMNESDKDFEFLCIIPYIDDMRIESLQTTC
jgi:quercetin dioxygenase-like cupin family protein